MAKKNQDENKIPVSLNTFYQGMNQDISKYAMKSDQYYEANNIRIVANSGKEGAAMVNIEGNDFMLEIPTSPKVIKIGLSEGTDLSGLTWSMTVDVSVGGLGNYSITITNTGGNPILQLASTLVDITAGAWSLNGIVLTSPPSYLADGLDGFFHIYDESSNTLVLWGKPTDADFTAYPSSGGADWTVQQVGSVSISSLVSGLAQNFTDVIQLAPSQPSLSVIGYTKLRDYIYLFTTNIEGEPGGPGQIWKLFIRPAIDNLYGIRSYVECVYTRAQCMNFTKSHPIEALGRYEKKDIQGIYWTDNYNPPRKLNIASGLTMSTPCAFLDLAPKTSFSMPILNRITNGGQLPAGVYQCSYRYKSGEGLTTDWSPLSNLVPIYDVDDDNPFCKIIGTEGDIVTKIGKITGKRIEWTIGELDTSYELIEVAAVYKKDNIPGNDEIYSFAELINGSSTLTVNLNGAENQIPISTTDFITGLGATFETVKTIESKDNKLFFGNIENTTFYIDFDARAYRYNSSSQALLDSQSDAPVIVDPAGGPGTILPANVPAQHDCINPFNIENPALNPNWFTNDQYQFQSDGGTLGGSGVNVSYRFITEQDLGDTQMDCPNLDNQFQLFFNDNSCNSHNTSPTTSCFVNPDSFGVTNAFINTIENLGISVQNYPMNNTFNNQKSPYKWSLYGSYARGETYRFGIVFYNNKGQASFVNWIGDIKIPFSYSTGTGQPTGTFAVSSWTWDFNSPTYNGPVDSNLNSSPLRMEGQVWLNQIGIDFDVNLAGIDPEIAAGLTGYSIVRVDRKDTDKSKFGTALCHTVDRLDMLRDEWDERVAQTPAGGGPGYSWGVVNNTSVLIPTTGYFHWPCGGWTMAYCDGATEGCNIDSWQTGTADNDDHLGYNVCKTRKHELLLYGALGWKNSDITEEMNLDEGLEVSYPVIRGDYLKIDQVFQPHFNNNMGLNQSYWPTGGAIAGEIQHYTNNWYKYYAGITAVGGINGSIQSSQIDYVDGTISNLNGMDPANNRYILDWGTWVPDAGFVDDTADESLEYSFYNVTNPGDRLANNYLPPAAGSATPMTLTFTWTSNRPRSIGSEVLLVTFDRDVSSWSGANHLMGASSNAVSGGVEVRYAHVPYRSTFSYERYADPYGGPTYGARTYSEYISTGHFYPINSGTNLLNTMTTEIWGGDVQCQIYDFTQFDKNWGQSAFDNYDTISATGAWIDSMIPSDATWGAHRACMVPLECHYRNVLWRHGYHFASKETVTGSYPNDGTQLHDEYLLNAAYDAKNDVRNYFPLPLTFSFGDEFDTRIYYSQTKINGEPTDSWAIFLINDYKDVEGVYGPINKLTRLHDTMYWFQDTGFGALSVNPTAVVQASDGTALQLGTVSSGAGAFIQDYKYISTQFGSSQQWAVTKSDNSIYFFDRRARKIFGYSSQGTAPLTDVTGLHSFLMDDLQGDAVSFDNPILKKGVTSTYDIMNNEALFTFHDSGFVKQYEQAVIQELLFGAAPNEVLQLTLRNVIPQCNPCFTEDCEEFDWTLSTTQWRILTNFFINGVGPFVAVMIGKWGCPGFNLPVPNPDAIQSGDILLWVPQAWNDYPAGIQPDVRYSDIDFGNLIVANVDCGIGQKSTTIAYNELVKGFTSFYDFHPSIYINSGTFLVTPDVQDICLQDPDVTGWKENNLYLHNYGVYGKFYDVIYPSTVTFISNMESAATKVFDNVSYHMESLWSKGRGSKPSTTEGHVTGLHSGVPNQSLIDIKDNTFDRVRFYTDYQMTGYVDLIPGTNIKKKEREWQMAVPRNIMDENIVDADIFNVFNYDPSRLNKDRLRDKYMFIDLIYNNYDTEVGEPRNIKFILHYFKTFFRPSFR